MHKFAFWITIVIFIVSFGALGFGCGFYFGKQSIDPNLSKTIESEIIYKLQDRIAGFTNLNINNNPPDIISGVISNISNQQLDIIASPENLEEALATENKTYIIKVVPKTKIYYSRIKENQPLVFTSDNTLSLKELFEETTINFDELKKNEIVSILIDPQEKYNQTIIAKEIKVNR